ncbi:hypothetical protein GA0070216_13352 [Micromonospora matsumotoense]|uniref:DUF11 domain-containing protein n=1 Tax=Micromonospora matsumotoense TaxID=121616 RepID=A0A1C5AVU7_9ACTN|nr:hypothetical protein [Micromonospora matsumotoense]SCF49317.1 hypothetical protein GA0070216_13352 [Micromonospora matsumotoense]
MPRVDARTVRRSLARRTPALVGAVLAAGLAVVLGVTPGLAAAPAVTRTVTDPTDVRTPGGDPTDETTPPVEPTATGPAPTGAPPTLPPDPEPTTPAPEPTGTTPETTAPAPTATSAPTAAPTPKPPLPSRSARPPGPNPDQPGGDRVGVQVTTGDIPLDDRYWRDPSTVATLRVTVTNTGLVPERLRLEYRLPAGLTDAGTPGCAAAGDGGWQCGEWTTAPGDRFTSLIRVRVGGTAWRQMPLSGAVRVTATGPDAGDTAQDNEGFAVLFPPGPPVPGILLDAEEVVFDISGGPTALAAHLGNTGRVDAAGRVEVLLPAGVSVLSPPAGCTSMSPTRTRCDLDVVPAGHTATLRFTVAATPDAQREAPLAGALIGWLDPESGPTRQVQMSFRITAAAALASPPVGVPAPTGSQGLIAAAGGAVDVGGMSPAQRTALGLIVLSVLLVALALVLATGSLRRRTAGPATDPPMTEHSG